MQFIKYINIILITAVLITSPSDSRCLEDGGTDYIIGPEDVIEITVWDNPDMSGKVSVSLEGYINYQLIGKVRASGISTGELAERITGLLSEGYLKNPQVTVRVVEYKSQKINIVGEIAQPGTYYLTKKTSLVEAIAKAGGPTKDADREIIVVRSSRRSGNDIPEKPDENEQIKIDLGSALEGDLSQNIYLQPGDSVFLPRVKSFSIMGEVKHPGKYNLDKGTTVIKAISMAGGTTDKAAMGRTKIVRTVEEKMIEKRADMEETLKPNDIIVVPESIF